MMPASSCLSLETALAAAILALASVAKA